MYGRNAVAGVVERRRRINSRASILRLEFTVLSMKVCSKPGTMRPMWSVSAPGRTVTISCSTLNAPALVFKDFSLSCLVTALTTEGTIPLRRNRGLEGESSFTFALRAATPVCRTTPTKALNRSILTFSSRSLNRATRTGTTEVYHWGRSSSRVFIAAASTLVAALRTFHDMSSSSLYSPSVSSASSSSWSIASASSSSSPSA
mmetsp:Transcript_19373/g.31740  ORF Transcript_19373/g.31740 Transcript_19373/m.31740 type:complete len:203 (+) Transcript_19373:2297-2905(+)